MTGPRPLGPPEPPSHPRAASAAQPPREPRAPQARRWTHRISSALAASAIAVPLALGVAGCGPRALTQDTIAGTLIEPDAAHLAGWLADPPSQAAPEGADGELGHLLAQTTGMSPACRDALSAFSATGTASAFASRVFTRSDGAGTQTQDLVVAVRGYDQQDPPRLPDPQATVRACPAFELSAQGQKLAGRLRAPTYDVADSAALGLDLSSGADKTSLDLIRVRRGANLITASITGPDEAANHDTLGRVAAAQADKVVAAS